MLVCVTPYSVAFLASIEGTGCPVVDNLWYKDNLLVIPTVALIFGGQVGKLKTSCARVQPSNAGHKGLLVPLAIPEHLWETIYGFDHRVACHTSWFWHYLSLYDTISVDLITELPATQAGFGTV